MTTDEQLNDELIDRFVDEGIEAAVDSQRLTGGLRLPKTGVIIMFKGDSAFSRVTRRALNQREVYRSMYGIAPSACQRGTANERSDSRLAHDDRVMAGVAALAFLVGALSLLAAWQQIGGAG